MLGPVSYREPVEVDRRPRGHCELAMAVQKPGAGKVRYRSLNAISRPEVAGIVSELANDLLDRQLLGMQIEQVCEHRPLGYSIVLSRAYARRPGTLLLHGSHNLLCRPPVVSAAGGTFAIKQRLYAMHRTTWTLLAVGFKPVDGRIQNWGAIFLGTD